MVKLALYLRRGEYFGHVVCFVHESYGTIVHYALFTKSSDLCILRGSVR